MKVDWVGVSSDSTSVADATEVVDGALADALDGEGELLAEAAEEEDDELVGFGMACFVSTIVTDTETVVASGSSTSVDLVTVWYTVAGSSAELSDDDAPEPEFEPAVGVGAAAPNPPSTSTTE